ncbi:MAG: UxaA family hydrolase, partial [Thermomicrobiales bacterium]|nr:UxaA family hydrolase [Thermomicrobiales bacterium]
MSSTSARPDSINLTKAPKEPVALSSVAVLLHPDDDIAVAKISLMPGTQLIRDDGSVVRIAQMIPMGHKVALHDIPYDGVIHKFGQIIGFATQEIKTGQHVHNHNMGIKELELDYAFSEDYAPVELVPASERRTFMGFRRPDGRVGTRNYVAILASVNCSSSATVRIAEYFRQPGAMDDYPNVDGVIALPHKGGCGAHIGSRDLYIFQRTLAGTVHHPNVAGYVVLSLGCEVNQPTDMIDATSMKGDNPSIMTIQTDGGFLKTVEAGIAAVKKILPEANKHVREEVPASELMVALQCGGSDGWSGVTANPGLGKAADIIVKQGGTVVLGETTEVYGAEHLLTRRAKTPDIGQKLIDCIHWWEDYTAYFGGSIDNNPSPGNKLGGLSNIY